MDTPISQKRLAANRANAVRSTGPRTADGKARSAQNARKHGFTASTFSVLRIEDVDQLGALRAEVIRVYQPVNAQELFTVERIALCQLSILRAARLEAGMFIDILNSSLNDDNITPFFALDPCLQANRQIDREQTRAYALANGFNRMMRGANGFALFLRYQTLAERQYRRAVEEFERLKRLRPEMPNEPTEEPDLEENTPDPPPQNEAEPAASPDDLPPSDPRPGSDPDPDAPPPPLMNPSPCPSCPRASG